MSIWWKLGGVLLAGVAAYFLITMYGSARYKAGKADEAVARSAKLVEAERGKLAAYQAGLSRQQAAETKYIETIRTLPPVTNTIIERATAYAATPDGASVCLPADRVLGLDEARAALFPATAPAAASSGQGALPADPAPPQR